MSNEILEQKIVKIRKIDLVGDFPQDKIHLALKPLEWCGFFDYLHGQQKRIERERIEYAIEVLDRCLRKKGTLDMIQKSDITGEISELRKQLEDLNG